VEYLPPTYGKICACPADFHGAFFNLIADDNQSAGLMTDSEVSINNMSLKRRKAFSIPKLKTASLSPNGKYLAGTDDKIHIWDSMAGKELFTLDVEASFSNFTPDSSAVIYATADKLAVWDIPGNQERFSLPLSPQHVVRTARCTADGRFLAAAERRGDVDGGNKRHIVALYDLKQPEPVHIFAGHQHAVVRLAVARDGSRLASSSLDGVVKVWDLAAATAAGQ
jgi:WD40 repeat protein